MRLMASGTFILATLLLCAPLSTSAAEIGITDVGTDAYPDGGLRLMTERPYATVHPGVFDMSERMFYHPNWSSEQTKDVYRFDLDTGDFELVIRRMPRMLGPYHILFDPAEEFDTLIANARSSSDVIACQVDFDGSRIGEYDVIGSSGMQYAATLATDTQFLLVDESSPINVRLFDRAALAEVDTLGFPVETGAFLGATYNANQNKLFVVTGGGEPHLSVVDMLDLESTVHVGLASVTATPAAVVIADDEGDSVWLVEIVGGGTPARVIRLNGDTFAVEEAQELDSGDTGVWSGFLSADESLLVLHANTRAITLDPATLEIQEGLFIGNLAPMQPHDSRSKAIVKSGPPSSTAVDILSLSPLQVIASPPYESASFWIPTQFIEDPIRGRTIQIGERLSPTPSREPRAAVLAHDPYGIESMISISPGVESHRSALDASRDLLVSIDSSHTNTSDSGHLSVLDRATGAPLVAYNDQKTEFRGIQVDASNGTIFVPVTSDAFIHHYNIETLELLDSIPPPTESATAGAMALNSIRRELYVVATEAKLHSYDADTLAHIDTLQLPVQSDFVVVDESRSLAYVGTSINAPDGFIHELDLESFTIVRDLALPTTDLRPVAMGIDPVRRVGWLGTRNPSSRLSTIDLATMTWKEGIPFLTWRQDAKFEMDSEFGRVVVAGLQSLRNPAFISIAQQGYIKATRLSIPSTADVESVHLYAHQAAGNIRAAIYVDGIDKTLFWQSDPTAVSVADAFLEIPIADGAPATLELPAGDYWLAWQVDNIDSVMSYAGESAGDGFLSVQDFGDFPSTLAESNVTVTGEQWAGYITAELAPIPGDIDGNGVLSVADVTLLAAMLNDHVIDEPNPEVADLNGDEVVDEADLQMLVEMIVE